MLLRSTLLVTLLAAGAAYEAPPREIAGPVEAQVIRVRDGDTVEVAAHVWPMQAVHVAVRLRGIDAPELRARCEAESDAAEKAKARLVALIGDGPVHLHRIAGDKYFGRVLADISSAGEPDVARRLLAEGLVAPYEGGRRRDWCVTRGS
ncbi:thermonuclease family protein [Aureimonas mangrovi]|uniref:thermonuclease family protein n=1 Tax=Aureimonas mangrovi TaxID=2758041 RepID=UPI00163D3FDB|nr:thermonuclease family protein [Aureimonas mangrovi]